MERLQARLGGAWRVRALHASTFCDTWRATSADADCFVKTMPLDRAEVLAAEADGLRALAATGTVRVPDVVDAWTDAHGAVLAMQWLDLAGRTSPRDGERLGRALAALHAAPAPGEGRFGWHRDNWLGATPQRNAWSRDAGLAGWLQFMAEARLRPLVAGLHEPLPDAVRRVIDAMPRLFDDGHVPRPSLVHGDLWSGNRGTLRDGTPVVFDPAVSVSEAEAELAMMELFGSPPAGFWPAYREAFPMSAGYPRRRPLYQLVHLLNHARLFGGGYGAQALAVARALASGNATHQ